MKTLWKFNDRKDNSFKGRAAFNISSVLFIKKLNYCDSMSSIAIFYSD
jgi:hypothetical protein